MKRLALICCIALLIAYGAAGVCPAAEPGGSAVLFDMDTVRHRPTTTGPENLPIGAVDVVPGVFGKACKFTFPADARAGFFAAGLAPSPAWDRAAGLSFWVKGDGSSSWGGLELIDASNYALRYGYCFPIDSTEWRKVTAAWRDLVPELPAGRPVDSQGGYAPSQFGNLWFGKWHYWGEYPAHSFTVDQIALEPAIEPAPAVDLPATPGTPRLLAKLKAGQPVTIVTMGDSLSDKRHWANREVLWSEVLAQKLKQQFGSDVTLVNPAIGGTQLTQNLVLMPRWLKEHPRPDLVTVWFGFNDWDADMRGEHFQQMLRFAVDRIRRMTGGQTEVLLMTTCPAIPRWDTMEELAEAARIVAAEKKTGLADVSASFHQAGADPAARAALFCRDEVHLGPAGHQRAAQTVLEAITADARPTDPLKSTGRLNSTEAGRHPVSQEHPRLLGSRQRLQELAQQRADAYARVVRVARQEEADEHAKMVSMALVSAIERDEKLGRAAIEMAMKMVEGPIRQGHVTFGYDLAHCAIVYDSCHEYWTAAERGKFHEYMNKTVDANVDSETHVFHNGWYAYKNWGIGLACYASYDENPRAKAILAALEAESRSRVAPALELAGDGGGWGEGYYIHYWLYEWLFFCEAARWCEGVDYYAMAPAFYRNRAVAGMFETYPGIGIYGSRRPIPMGDGGGRVYGGDRDKELSARRILVDYFRDDPAHQAVNAFNETTPRSSGGANAYKDFLWRDTTVPKADLGQFRLSHVSPGPGYVYARSSWDDDATYFFFKCGDRFTAHQHLDVGHFLIYKHDELAGDGGHYDEFGTPHDVNYHMRSIAHNTILIHDPAETWPGIRAGKVTGNDGGQMHGWPHHNGAVSDAAAWNKDRQLYDIADLLAMEDTGDYVYVAGDCARAYSRKKLDGFTRQIVFLRPGTFLIFDRVTSPPEMKKTWLLQAMKRPESRPPQLVITNGQGRLFVETLLPRDPLVTLHDGQDLYSYGGKNYPPGRDTGPAPECRIEVTPSRPAKTDYFLHVLTAVDATVDSIAPAVLEEAVGGKTGGPIRVRVGKASVSFDRDKVGGYVEIAGRRRALATGIAAPADRQPGS